MYLLESVEIRLEWTRPEQLDLFVKKMTWILSMEMKNMEDNLRDMNELEVKGLSDRLAVVYKGLQEVKSEPSVFLLDGQ